MYLTRKDAIVALLGRVYPTLPASIATARRLGWYWEDISTPFVEWDGERPASHVGVLLLPSLVCGQGRGVAAIHAVLSDPDLRGRGHFGRAMERALDFTDRHTDLACLCTDQPALYERYGFRLHQERCGVIPVPPAAPGPLRKLGESPDDLALLRRILCERAPLSFVWSTRDTGWMVAFNEVLASGGLKRLWYAEDLDAVLAAEVRDGVLLVLDVLAATLPPLDLLLGRYPDRSATVAHLYFSPDRLAWGCDARAITYAGDELLMLRGEWPFGDRPVMLPGMSRC